MGRYSKGVCFTSSSFKLEINHFKKSGVFKANSSGRLTWQNENNLNYNYELIDGQRILKIAYGITRKGVQTNCNYIIEIKLIPSNLGKGFNYYFICPVSGQLAKILYLCYDSLKFMHRDEYTRRNKRIYYPIQTASKYEYHDTRYWELERRTIPKLKIKRGKKCYKGKPTKRALRLEKSRELLEHFDRERWKPKNLPKNCLGYLWQFGKA
jgi:hypothetical protein